MRPLLGSPFGLRGVPRLRRGSGVEMRRVLIGLIFAAAAAALGRRFLPVRLRPSTSEELSNATKEQLVRRLASRTKDVLVQALGAHLTKEELQRIVDAHTPSESDQRDGKEEQSDGAEQQRSQSRSERRGAREGDGDARERGRARQGDAEGESDTELDWNAELAWAPAPRPTPAPVAYAGAAPFMPSQRVRVDLSGLPFLGVFAGTGTSAAGTIVGVNAQQRAVRVYLDASFDGKKEIVVPPERIVPDG